MKTPVELLTEYAKLKDEYDAMRKAILKAFELPLNARLELHVDEAWCYSQAKGRHPLVITPRRATYAYGYIVRAPGLIAFVDISGPVDSAHVFLEAKYMVFTP